MKWPGSQKYFRRVMLLESQGVMEARTMFVGAWVFGEHHEAGLRYNCG